MSAEQENGFDFVYHPKPHKSLEKAVTQILRVLERASGRTVALEYAGTLIPIVTDDTPYSIAEKHRAFSYQEQSKRRAIVHEEIARQQAARTQGRLDHFNSTIANVELERSNPQLWDEEIARTENHPYINLAERMGRFMQVGMAEGSTLPVIAKACLHMAANFGEPGDRFSAALQLLARCWKYGDELAEHYGIDVTRPTPAPSPLVNILAQNAVRQPATAVLSR